MRSAVIDLGSNTFHALVAKIEDGAVKSILLDDKIAVRLGEHAFARRRICDDAYARGFAALGELIERVHSKDCDSLAIVATGVFREASNGRRFLAEARGTYDVDIELLDGRDEARLTWLGVATELGLQDRRLAVLDLGGGSLECATGTRFVENAHSLPLGMLRLRNHQPQDARAIVESTARHVIAELSAFAPEVLALSSGTARVLLRLARSIGRIPAVARYVPTRTLGELATMLTSLCSSALDELDVPEDRRDTIAAGAIVLDTIVQAVGVRQVYVARAALREGLLASVTNSLEPAIRAQCMR
jgi:exopolyphosphatase/guanosine-5'-triphosphate,3'-diphosphate pyrophosphatase